MDRKTQEKKSVERQLVVFSISDEEFGIDINKVNSIIKMEKITKIPNAEYYIEGMINLRGKIIVVINLNKKLHLDERKWDKNTRIIVVELEHDTVGIIVDAVNEVLRLSENKIEEAPPVILEKIDADYLQGVGVLGERLVILLDVDKVLHKKELEAIKNISMQANKENESNEEDDDSEKKARHEPESEKEYFWFHNGKSVKSVEELIIELKQIKDDVFNHHVDSERNDFSSWIKHVLKDEALAKEIEKETSKQKIISILKEHI